MIKGPITFFWFRRDLRLHDNAGLYHALKNTKTAVYPVFIFDTDILDRLEDVDDARVSFIHDTIMELDASLQTIGSSLLVRHGRPRDIWRELIEEFDVDAVYANRDYEPYAIQRDAEIEQLLANADASFHTYKDHVLFEFDEVLKPDGNPYVVFTPYKRRWLERLDSNPHSEYTSSHLKLYANKRYFKRLASIAPTSVPSLQELGFEPSTIGIPARAVKQKVIREYTENRDFPAIAGTSRLGIHFRFGTVSIREKARKAMRLNHTYLSELIWRDFYAQILAHFPHVVQGAFRRKYDHIEWRNCESEFDAWCQGMTGYPLVDAGMRELNATGFMHNRVRMVVASFLTKHLLVDWRWGEAYFARKLLDFDLASNNGGWQWAAGCGTDAAPYFRIFNPESQMKKFDKNQEYVRKWVPEYGTEAYPNPIVEHKMARERCLKTYKAALG